MSDFSTQVTRGAYPTVTTEAAALDGPPPGEIIPAVAVEFRCRTCGEDIEWFLPTTTPAKDLIVTQCAPCAFDEAAMKGRLGCN
jgi:hypothetical protein